MGELGTLLVRAREARGLTLEDAERDTRISRRYLQALESEQFEVIPAPVYARGFLRSYSQYLGIDPLETLSMFPREDDEAPVATASAQRPPVRQPPSAVGAARPAWRRPTAPQSEYQRSEERISRPVRREPPRRDHDPALPLEPVIGVDIGVPAPSRRIKTDPAAQTRSVVIAIVALAAVVAVLLVAFLISNLGGGGSPSPSAGGAGTASAGSSVAPAGQLTAAAGGSTSSAAPTPSTPGVMPNVVGQASTAAKAVLTAAGIKFIEKPQKSSRPKGEVIDQTPGPDSQVSVGFTAIIVVSDGP